MKMTYNPGHITNIYVYVVIGSKFKLAPLSFASISFDLFLILICAL